MKILDCTLRDGGYYTNWDFEKEIVDQYITSSNVLPIDYLELGYRNIAQKEYMGKYGFSPVYELENIRNKSKKKLAIMLNEKSTTQADLDFLLSPIKGIIDMVRLAIDPKNINNAIQIAEAIKNKGFEVGFNLMYMSNWKNDASFLPQLENLDGKVDLFCMVDSFGGITPNEIKKIMELVRKYTSVPLGFHGHNNLELGLINALTAIELKVDYIDATILGMGRGAGNLKMELLLTYLNKHQNLEVDFNALGDVISAFKKLQTKYEWGTNLPYMISGANSLPQKDVMEWVSNRVYSFNSIVRALNNIKSKKVDNEKYLGFNPISYDSVVIIGGGLNALLHIEGIKEFINKHENIALIHATSRNSSQYLNINVDQFYCLVGSEGKRLIKVILDHETFKGTCILPPYPRKMGTDVPLFAKKNTYELNSIDFTEDYQDSCTTIALQTALTLNAKNIYIVGYDGYSDGMLTVKERDLSMENQKLFVKFKEYSNLKLVSLTPSYYTELITESVYQHI